MQDLQETDSVLRSRNLSLAHPTSRAHHFRLQVSSLGPLGLSLGRATAPALACRGLAFSGCWLGGTPSRALLASAHPPSNVPVSDPVDSRRPHDRASRTPTEGPTAAEQCACPVFLETALSEFFFPRFSRDLSLRSVKWPNCHEEGSRSVQPSLKGTPLWATGRARPPLVGVETQKKEPRF